MGPIAEHKLCERGFEYFEHVAASRRADRLIEHFLRNASTNGGNRLIWVIHDRDEPDAGRATSAMPH